MEAEYLSRLGYCHAALGNDKKAGEFQKRIQNIPGNNPELLHNKNYYTARIKAGEGKKQEAVDLLALAIKQGFSFYRPAVFKADSFLRGLKDFEPFIELVGPKG